MAITIRSKSLDIYEDQREFDPEFDLVEDSGDGSEGLVLQEPIQAYLDKLGEELRLELEQMNPNDERLLNLALNVLLLMFRRAARQDFIYCQDTYVEIKHQGVRIKGKISDWKQVLPSVGQGCLSIVSGSVGFLGLGGQAFRVILPAGGVIFKAMEGLGAAAPHINSLGSGSGAFAGVVSNYNLGGKTILEIDLDKMKNKLSDRTQTAAEKTSKCAETARKVQEILGQRFSVFQQMTGISG